LIGPVGTAACLGGVAAIFFSKSQQNLLVWLLIGYISFFASWQGAVIWVFIRDVFPNRAGLGSLRGRLPEVKISLNSPFKAASVRARSGAVST
jgi:hypothetical protein